MLTDVAGTVGPGSQERRRAAVDAVLEKEDEIYDELVAIDDSLVDELLENEDDLYESLLADNDALVDTLLEETSPTISADVQLVDTVIEQVTADISPADQLVAQQAATEVTP